MAKAFLSKYLHGILDHSLIPISGKLSAGGNISGANLFFGAKGQLVYFSGGGGNITLQGADDDVHVYMGGYSNYIYIYGSGASEPNIHKMEFGARTFDWYVNDYSDLVLLLTSGGILSGLTGQFATISATNYIGVSTTPSAWADYVATSEVSAVSGLNLNNLVGLSAVDANHALMGFSNNQLLFADWGVEVPDGNDAYFGTTNTYLEIPASNDRLTFYLTGAEDAMSLIQLGTTGAYLDNRSAGFTHIGTSSVPFGSAYFQNISATNYFGISTIPSAWADYAATSNVDLSGRALSAVSSISGTSISAISGYYDTVSAANYLGITGGADPSGWATYPAVADISASDYNVSANNFTTSGGVITFPSGWDISYNGATSSLDFNFTA